MMKRIKLFNINTKILAILIVGLLYGGAVIAQAAKPAMNAVDKPIEIPGFFSNPAFYILFITVTILIATIMTLLYTIRKLTDRLVQSSTVVENGKPETIQNESSEDWSKKLIHSLTASVPVAEEKDVLMDHDYDGIQELDNKLPPWWVMGFYITIIFAVIYIANYHIFKTGKLQLAEYKQEINEANQQKAELMKNATNNITAENVKQLTDATALTEGKEIFKKNCIACHREDAGGNVGPNLTDDFWIHGGGIKNIFNTITEGVPAKGMITWKTQLAPKQIQAVASYVMSLHGTNPVAPKEPQGDKWVETKPAADSATVKDSVIKKK